MTTCTDELHVLLGGFVLGGLSEEDNQAYQEHRRSCQECREEFGELAGISGILDLLRTADPGQLAPL